MSPGSPTGSLVAQICPTFSWGTVAGARSYELVVYRVKLEGEESQVILGETFDGSVNSWTPSLDRCLERGNQYAWSVRAVGQKDFSEWSVPNLFRVVDTPNPEDFQAALELVRTYLEGNKGPATEGSADAEGRDATLGAVPTAGAAAERALPAETALSVSGNIDATSFTGDGENLSGVATDAELTTHTGETGAHHAPPTSLPPSGPAGGDLAGTYPDPTVGSNAVGSAEITDSSVAVADLAFDPATQGELDTHTGSPSAHHMPTADTDTTCLDPGVSCNFAASSSEGGDALSGDSATGFFTTGQIEEPRIDDSIARDSELSLLLLCADGKVGGWRYWDMGDGTVLDCNTNLLWLKDASCADLGPNGDGTATWDEAEAAAAALASGTCGLTDGSVAGDWRQPTAVEFCSAWDGSNNFNCPSSASPDSLVDTSVGPPHVVNARGDVVWTEGDAFVGVLSNAPPCYELFGNQVCAYWTSSDDPNDASDTNRVLVDIYFEYINGDNRAFDFSVWPVREP